MAIITTTDPKNDFICSKCGNTIWAGDPHGLETGTGERLHAVCPEFRDESQDEVYKRFLSDLWRSYRFNYTPFEEEFITKNKDRDVEQWPYTEKQRVTIDKIMKKYLKRM